VEPLSPNMVTICRFYELHIDPQPIFAALNGTFEDIAHAELAADLRNIDLFSLVGEGRAATNNQQFIEARQVGGQALSNAIDEIFLFGIPAHVREGQNDDGKSWRLGLRSSSRQRCQNAGSCPSLACRPVLSGPPHVERANGTSNVLESKITQ